MSKNFTCKILRPGFAYFFWPDSNKPITNLLEFSLDIDTFYFYVLINKIHELECSTNFTDGDMRNSVCDLTVKNPYLDTTNIFNVIEESKGKEVGFFCIELLNNILSFDIKELQKVAQPIPLNKLYDALVKYVV